MIRPGSAMLILGSMEPNMTNAHLELDRKPVVRMLALAPVEMQGQIRRHLASLGVVIDFVSKAVEVSQLALSRSYHVALLPAVLPDNGWWSLWGEIMLLNPRPEILVYAHKATFELWSGVLEIGGYDVIVEPFTGEELQRAVSRAARSFEERWSDSRDQDREL
jgi:DNA-binding response OmpR family regulator